MNTTPSPAIEARYKPAGHEAESWNSPLHTMQERLEICAGAVKFERSCGNNARKQRSELQALVELLKQEAQIHAQEARTANATIAEIYQLCTGATGEPGNWNGAEPVRAVLAAKQEEVDKMTEHLQFVERWANHHGQKPHTTPQEALSVIQHYPPILAITRSYDDGKAPETPNPYAELNKMREALGELLAAQSAVYPNFEEGATAQEAWSMRRENAVDAARAALSPIQGAAHE